MTLLINLIGLFIIAFIVWWFWLSKAKIIRAGQNNLIEIKVKDGVYQPAYIQVKMNQPFTLRFIREDATPCAEIVVFSRLNLSKALPLHKPIDIPLTLTQVGEYGFTCQMGMYRGTLAVIK